MIASVTSRKYLASGVIGAIIIWYAIQGIGWLSYLISILGGALILLLSILALEETEEQG